MQPLVERAAAILRRQSVPALPLGELARLVAQSGVAVSETVLLRALLAEPERFRLLQPWRALGTGERGVQKGSARAPEGGVSAPSLAHRARPAFSPGARGVTDWSSGRVTGPATGTAAPPVTRRAAGPVTAGGELWVLPGATPERGDPARAERAALRRLRASLLGLGWAVDATSARDLSRWAGMVLEGERFRRALSPDQRVVARDA